MASEQRRQGEGEEAVPGRAMKMARGPGTCNAGPLDRARPLCDQQEQHWNRHAIVLLDMRRRENVALLATNHAPRYLPALYHHLTPVR